MSGPTLTTPRGLTLEVELPVTINRAVWEKLPVHKLPSSYRYSDHLGNGCFGDPPGYPSYFTQSVYTSHGNDPRKGATLVLFGRVVQTAEDSNSERNERLLRRLWNPLPLEHPRTQAWIAASFKHSAHCYIDDEGVSLISNRSKSDKLVIWPVPYYELKTARIDEHWTDAYKAAVQAELDEYNGLLRQRREQVAIPENHTAVRKLRRFYPDAPIPFDLLDNPPERNVGDWWERMDRETPPSPEECPGDDIGGRRRHPTSQTWCQMCGWYAA